MLHGLCVGITGAQPLLDFLSVIDNLTCGAAAHDVINPLPVAVMWQGDNG